MSTDTFEDELRSLLRDTADAEGPAYVDVDPNAVVTRGRRVVRRRRLATGAGIAAAAVAVGLVGFAAIGGGGDGAAPVPGTTSTTITTGTATADLARGATLPGSSPSPSDGANVRVTVDRRTGRVTYLADRDGTMQEVGFDQLPSSPDAVTWRPTPVQGLVVGVLPVAARDVTLRWGGRSPASTRSVAPLEGTAFQAFAVWHDGRASETTLAGLHWTDGTTVYRDDGSAVDSARLGGVVAFADPAQDIAGMFGDGTIATASMIEVRSGNVPVLMMGRQEGSDLMDTALLLVLPVGARDVVVTPAAGATVESTEYAAGGATGATLVVARLQVPVGVDGTGASTVAWTGADGRQWSNPANGINGR